MGFNIISATAGAGVSGSVSGVASGFKPSIVLADFKPGTRSIVLPAGSYRVACVGGGGGAAGARGGAVGGTSSWAATHSATGGSAGAVGGAGTGGDTNTSGGSTAAATVYKGAGASGHRLGSAPDAGGYASGGGWSSDGHDLHGGMGLVDGFGLGLPPGTAQIAASGIATARPGCGAGFQAGHIAGMGGGGCGGAVPTGDQNFGGPGGGGEGGGASTYPGSGGGYSEKVITVAASTSFSYTVGAAGSARAGAGALIIERL